MKKVILLSLLAGFVASCGSSPEEKVIADYEQTIDNSKIDLKFKAQEIKLLGQVTAVDSFSYYKAYLDKKSAEKISSLEESKGLYHNKKDIDRLNAAIKLYQTDYADTFLEPVYKKVKHYETLGNQKIGDIYQCRYKINNPFLGGVEQELTKQYLIDEAKTKILAKL